MTSTPQEKAKYFIGNKGVGLDLPVEEWDENSESWVPADYTGVVNPVPVTFKMSNTSIEAVTLNFYVNTPKPAWLRRIMSGDEFTVDGDYEYQVNPTFPPTEEFPMGRTPSTDPEFSEPRYLKVRKKLG